MAPQFKVASPCHESWERMQGDDRVRHCAECDLNVYNFSVMTTAEAAELVATHEGRLCGRLYRRADGTVITRDCPVGARLVVIRRVSRIAGAALAGAMSVGMAAGQTVEAGETKIRATSNAYDTLGEISITVADMSGAVIPNAKVLLVNKQTQAKREGVTDAKGTLRLRNLQSGKYDLSVSSPGFWTDNHVISVSEHEIVEAKIALEVGTLTGVIEITDDEPVGVTTFPGPNHIDEIPTVPVTPPPTPKAAPGGKVK